MATPKKAPVKKATKKPVKKAPVKKAAVPVRKATAKKAGKRSAPEWDLNTLLAQHLQQLKEDIEEEEFGEDADYEPICQPYALLIRAALSRGLTEDELRQRMTEAEGDPRDIDQLLAMAISGEEYDPDGIWMWVTQDDLDEILNAPL